MHVHTGCQPGIMDLHALNVVRDQKGSPAVVDFLAVRQKLEIPFDHTGQAIRLSDAQTEAVLVERASGRVPEFAKRLRSVAESPALPDRHMKRMADREILRVVALADPQQDIAVEQTGAALRHQSRSCYRTPPTVPRRP